MLKLIDVHTFYGKSAILKGVSLSVERGGTVALLGRNGMGKTTTVRSIMGLTPARDGVIVYKGMDIARLPTQEIARLGIALVPQGRKIFPSLSVKENLIISMRGNGYSLESIYSHFPVLLKRADNRGHELSGGEQQMLSIARALLGNPELLLMDEPSEGLAPVIIDQIAKIVLDLKAKQLSIFLVEQNVPLALKVCDFTYVIHNGYIVHCCSASELALKEDVLVQYIGVSQRQMRN